MDHMENNSMGTAFPEELDTAVRQQNTDNKYNHSLLRSGTKSTYLGV